MRAGTGGKNTTILCFMSFGTPPPRMGCQLSLKIATLSCDSYIHYITLINLFITIVSVYFNTGLHIVDF